ncbi:GNAT family N-acetyltransferase [Halobacillus sp. H74]|uniref:GNAT family N-acetyltransferase n=1 Tax=Halobacillus sp. H74 TaxID=3457436 RepID=UPI003FCCF05D
MIELKPFTADDYDQLIQWVDTPAFLMQWAGPTFHYPLNKEQLKDYSQTSDRISFKVIHKNSGETTGHISIGRIDPEQRKARIGKIMVPSSKRGRGLGTEIMKKMLAFAFNELSLKEVTLGVFDFNTAGICCYEKVGFKKKNLLRNHRKVGNEYWNLLEMSMTKMEWEKNKQG